MPVTVFKTALLKLSILTVNASKRSSSLSDLTIKHRHEVLTCLIYHISYRTVIIWDRIEHLLNIILTLKNTI